MTDMRTCISTRTVPDMYSLPAKHMEELCFMYGIGYNKIKKRKKKGQLLSSWKSVSGSSMIDYNV